MTAIEKAARDCAPAALDTTHSRCNPRGSTPKAQGLATDDPLVGWFDLGRNVKPRRTWKGGK